MGAFVAEDVAEALADLAGIEEREQGHGLKLDLAWQPKLNPVQLKVYRSQADYILAYGERGTGKSIGALHKAVRHAVHNKNARVLIVVREVGQATEGGAWSKLQTEILPQWANGNFDRKSKKLVDRGCGIEFTAQKLDHQDKKPFVWVSNRFGGWSMIKLISLFVGEHVEDKVKGKEPSFIFVDEAQTLESSEYFDKLIQQLGRAQDITDPQQIVYCCNPKGPSHWLHRTFFCHQKDEDGKSIESPIDPETGHPIDSETGRPIPDYAIFHVPISENAHNLPSGYWQKVLNACKNDPIEHARMVEGLWVDKPEGDAIFKDSWKDAIHLRGDAVKGIGLLPKPGHIFVLGWDPGAAHTSVHMQQFIPTPKKVFWMVFDEMNCVGKYMPYRTLVPKLIDRLQYWEEAASDQAGVKVQFNFRHISDESAFNQFRAKEGSFDAQDIEEISRAYVQENNLPERFIIKMRACPKGPHSVEARVRIVTDLLIEESILVSATCTHTRSMFMNLECDKESRMKPRRSIYVHPFDSLSYPMLFYNSGAGRSATKVIDAATKPEFYRVGGGNSLASVH